MLLGPLLSRTSNSGSDSPTAYVGPNSSDVDFVGKGLVYWDKAVEEFSAACELKLSNAFTDLRSDTLFIHPIKLSKWT